jgi:DNA-binding CsgD family transcriptional regulator
MLIARAGGKIEFADPAARRWLKQFFGRPAKAGVLPRKLCRWISSHNHLKTSRALLAETPAARLYLKTQPAYTDANFVLLLELIKGKSEERRRRHRQLTPRERQVLFWVARGKTNPETAAILSIAPSTVGKHLERVYAKIGVENRTAASNCHLRVRAGLAFTRPQAAYGGQGPTLTSWSLPDLTK